MPFRSVSAERALDTALAEIDRLGLTAQVTVADQTMCVTLLRDGARVATGAGKGPGAQGAASAHFEALERCLMSAPDNRRRAAPLLSATAVAGQPALEQDLVIQRWAAEFPDSVAACASYDGVRYPTFLTDPRYHRRPAPGDDVRPYRGLLRYSSSLGTAAGVDLAEAVYHGLCELVEHDALSQALLRWHVAGAPETGVVTSADLPDELSAQHEQAARAAGAPVELLDVTTDLDVPVYLAVTTGGRVGAGASCWATDAAARALAELVQICSLPPSTKDRQLAAWPALRRCAAMPLDELVRQPVPLRADPAGDGSPEWGRAQVRRAMERHGLDHHVCAVAPVDSLIAVATTIAPGLERFSLVRHGVPVVPTGRGQRLWPSPLTRRAS